MKGFWKDFKEFISKGNIIDLAIAVIVGGAFGKIVSSLVNDIIMPLISLITSGVSVADWKWVITPANEAAGIAESSLKYGMFLQSIIDFLIIAFFIFLAIRILQKSKKKIEEITNEIKTEVKKKRKTKKGEIIEEIREERIIEKQDSVNETQRVKDSPIEEIVKETQKSNRSQEKLLREIRDLLKK